MVGLSLVPMHGQICDYGYSERLNAFPVRNFIGSRVDCVNFFFGERKSGPAGRREIGKF